MGQRILIRTAEKKKQVQNTPFFFEQYYFCSSPPPKVKATWVGLSPMIKLFSLLKTKATVSYTDSASVSIWRWEECWYYQVLVSQKGRYYRNKRKIACYLKWEFLLLLFTVFSINHNEAEQALFQYFTSTPKFRHHKIFMKILVFLTVLSLN